MADIDGGERRATRLPKRERYGSLNARAAWLADVLRRRIWSYIPGSRLPGERELARRFRVSLRVARRAAEILESEGLIAAHRGKGSAVAAEPSTPLPVRRIIAVLGGDRSAAIDLQNILIGAQQAAAQLARPLDVLRADEIDLSRVDCLQTAMPDAAGCMDVGWLLLRVAPRPHVLDAWRLGRLSLVFVDHDPAVAAHTVNAAARNSTFLAAERALLLGHRRVAYVGNVDAEDYSSVARWHGFQLAMQRHQQPIPESHVCHVADANAAATAIAPMLAAADAPTCIVAANPALGCAAIDAAESLGLGLGTQVSVIATGLERIGLTDARISRLSRMSEGRPERLGQLAAKLLFESHLADTPVKLFSECEWIDCGSLRPHVEHAAERAVRPAATYVVPPRLADPRRPVSPD